MLILHPPRDKKIGRFFRFVPWRIVHVGNVNNHGLVVLVLVLVVLVSSSSSRNRRLGDCIVVAVAVVVGRGWLRLL